MKHLISKNSTKLAIKFAVSFGLLLFFIQSVEMNQVWSLWAETHFSYLPIMLLLSQLVFMSYRWQLLTRIPLFESYRITAFSTLANTLLITSIGGMIVRAALTIRPGLSLAEAVAATVMDRLFTMLVIAGMAFFVLPQVFPIIDVPYRWPLAVGTVSIIAAVIIAIIALQEKTDFKLCQGNWVGVFLYSILAQALFFWAVYEVANSIHPDIDFWQLMAILPFATFATAIPISVGGWGIREGAYIYGLAFIGLSSEEAFLLSIQIGVIGVLTTVIASIPAVLTTDMKSLLSNIQKRGKAKTRS